jgi:hypothetical protein
MANGTLVASQLEMLTLSGTGVITIVPPNTNTNRTLTLPDVTDTVAGIAATQTLTNKTLTSPTLTTPNIDSAQFATVTGTAPIYPCRAWVNFNGTGTPAIRGSGNVSSITDQGVGLYKVNFTTAMPDINYSAVGGAGQSSGDYSRYVGFNGLQTSSGVEIRIAYPATDGASDPQLIMVSIFR